MNYTFDENTLDCISNPDFMQYVFATVGNATSYITENTCFDSSYIDLFFICGILWIITFIFGLFGGGVLLTKYKLIKKDSREPIE